MIERTRKMENSKEWYKSKAVWASLVVVIVGTLGMFGLGELEGEEETITELVMQIVTVVSSIVALVGRVTAKSKIGSGGSAISPLLMLSLVALLALSLPGCGKVRMSPEYAQQLEMAAVNISELNSRCQSGDNEACKLGLAEAAETLNILVDGLHGIDSSNSSAVE